MRRCKVCGAILNTGTAHRHEDAGWKPMYDDFEGALEGYETVACSRPVPEGETTP